MNSVELPGCTPEPLMSYLKALGIFRLIAEQADANAKLSWANGLAVLHSTLDPAGLTKFFLEDYKPTPVLAPWNGGSGFYGGGEEPLLALQHSTAKRFEIYRETINIVRDLVPKAKPKDDDKQDLLAACRNHLPEANGAWLDTCFALQQSGEEISAAYFPLLGTGGNDGRLDFTNNFFQRIANVLPLDDRAVSDESRAFFDSAIFGDVQVCLGKTAIGQFNPGGIGGPNGQQGKFEADSRVNPWDFVLMIEGSMLFAGSVARRLGTGGPAKAVFPFSVESVAAGYGSATASEETTDGSRAELWLPLWDGAASYAEVKHLFAEGRAQVGRRQAKNAVEFALAVNLLGVNRGVKSFSRYGFLKRNGLAFLATPLGRLEVKLRPDARLLDDPPLREWVDKLRRACREKDKVPQRYQTALRGIDQAMFEFANRSEHGNDAKYLLEVLRAIGRAERTLANGLRFCQEKYLTPIHGLNLDWLLLAKPKPDEWRTFRLAASLASILNEHGTDIGSFRSHLEPVETKTHRSHLEPVETKTHWPKWSLGSTSAVWSNRPLADNLSAVLLRRALEAEQAGRTGVPLRHRVTAKLSDVLAFLADHNGTQDQDIADLLFGLIGLKWHDHEWFKANRDRLQPAFQAEPPLLIPEEFATARLVVQPLGLLVEQSRWRVAKHEESPSIKLKPDLRVHHRLTRSDGGPAAIEQALLIAGRRLHADQLANYFGPQKAGKQFRPTARFNASRLAAACLFPLSRSSLSSLVNRIATAKSVTAFETPESEE